MSQARKKSTIALDTAVFVCGAVVMVYEINGSRILAPHIGTSTYVWTSLIGVILAALSFGYWFGGKLADKKPSVGVLASAVFAAAGLVSLTILVKDVVLAFIAAAPLILEIKSLIAAMFLFAPASVLLGFVTPYAVKLRTVSLDSSGATVGRLYALSTIGSIVGTFAAGFFLIPFLGSSRTLYLVAASLFLVSLLLAPFALTRRNLTAVVLFIFGVVTNEAYGILLYQKIELIDTDTEYNRVQIFRMTDPVTGRPERALSIDPATIQSRMYLDGDDLASEYLHYYHLARLYRPDFRHSLMIGGAGYSFPKEYFRTYPGRTIDTVEIDPGMTALARKYFGLKDDPRHRVFHEDGRIFLNHAPDSTYDAVFLDAFTALFSVPFHLTTRESAAEISRVLTPDGVVIFNLGGALSGPRGRFFQAELATYRSVFPEVLVFKVRPERPDDDVQNLIIVAKKTIGANPAAEDPELLRLQANRRSIVVSDGVDVLSDDLAPVEYFNSGF